MNGMDVISAWERRGVPLPRGDDARCANCFGAISTVLPHAKRASPHLLYLGIDSDSASRIFSILSSRRPKLWPILLSLRQHEQRAPAK